MHDASRHGTGGVARTKKLGEINENFLAMPSTSLKICYYPLPTSWRKWRGEVIAPHIPVATPVHGTPNSTSLPKGDEVSCFLSFI